MEVENKYTRTYEYSLLTPEGTLIKKVKATVSGTEQFHKQLLDGKYNMYDDSDFNNL